MPRTCCAGTSGSQGGGILKALFAGTGVALLGGAVWFGVLYYFRWETGLLSIAIGYCVGKTVRWASGNRGGGSYQVLAVAVTYFGIVSAYVPYVIKDVMTSAKEKKSAQTPAAGAKAGSNAQAGSSPASRPPAKADAGGGFLKGVGM